MTGMVFCHYLKKEALGLNSPPFPGPIGDEIVAKVSQVAWSEWLEMQTKIINEYRLDLSVGEDRKKLMQQMRNFLSLDNADGARANILHVGTPTVGE